MQDDENWDSSYTGYSTYKLAKSEGSGKWIIAALIFAIIIHAAIIWGFSKIDVILPQAKDSETLQTRVITVLEVDKNDTRPEIEKLKPITELEPIETLAPVDELDILENMADIDIDVLPDLDTYQVPLIEPVSAGSLEGESMEPMKSPTFNPDLPEMGVTEDFFPRANDTQLLVDPGARMAEEFDPDEYTDQLRKGSEGEADDSILAEFASLDAMSRMDGNTLQTSKALIGSDLLFDFNSSTLRQSARLSLMKVALLIDKHPKLICWIEGHTDLIGSESFNQNLSEKRALAVKQWLVETLDLDEQRVAVLGHGKNQPLVTEGNEEEQAANRRVVIKMRKNRPTKEVTTPKPRTGPTVQPEPIAQPEPATQQEEASLPGITQIESSEPQPLTNKSEEIVEEPKPAVIIEETSPEPVLVKPKVPPPAIVIDEEDDIPHVTEEIIEQAPPRAIIELEEETDPEPTQPAKAIPVEE